MALKKVNPLSKERTKLLGFLLKLDTSMSTILRIARMLENRTTEQAEELASQIFDKIMDCKDEADIIERLFEEKNTGSNGG